MSRTSRRGAVVAGATTALLLFPLFGCSIESPELPTFETEWLIPLGVIDETVEELIADEEDFVVAADGTISLSTSGELDAVALGQQLDVEVDGISFSAAIGAVRLEATDPVGFDHRLGDIYPPAEAADGLDSFVPPFTFDLAADPQDLPGFRSATLHSGGLAVDVDNGLPVPVGGNAAPEQLLIALLDPSDGSTVVDFVVDGPIAPGSSWSEVLDLSGRVLPDSVAVRLTGGSPGSGSQIVTVDADSRLSVQVSTTELEVSEARASFGAQSFEDTSRVDLPDSIRIVHAEVGSGQLVVRLRNDLPVPAQADLSVPGFATLAGEPLVLDIPLAAGSVESRTVDLADYVLDFGGVPGESLEVIASLSTPGSGGDAVTIRSTDVVAVEVQPLSLRFDAVTGIVDPMEIALDPASFTIEIPEDLEDMQLADAELQLGFRSSLGLPVTVDLRLEGTNADGEMVPLDTSFDLPAVIEDQPQVHARTLSRDNSTIVDFLNNLPTNVVFEGIAHIGDGVTAGRVAATDSVSARWSISAPMTVAVAAQTIDSDPESLDLDEDLRRDLEERLVELTLEADVLSTLPLAAVAYIGVDTDSTALFRNPALRLGPILIPAAGPVGPGGVRAPATVRSTVVVTRDDVPLLTRPGAWQGMRLQVPGTGGEFVSLRATDAVEVRGFLRARVLMGEVDR